MLKEAIEKIVSLAKPETYEIAGSTYTTTRLERVTPHIDRPSEITFSSLDGIVQAVKAEIKRVVCPVFINVNSYKQVKVFTTYRQDNMQRDLLYTASPDLLERLPEWMGRDDATIALRSRFIPTEGTDYILNLLSSLSDDNSVGTTDNGLTQTATVKQGISLQAKVKVNPRVALKPFRTFLEVEQPESEFLLRLRPGDSERGKEAQIGLFEADGGAWKLAAKHNIAEYFTKELSGLIKSGSVIVTE